MDARDIFIFQREENNGMRGSLLIAGIGKQSRSCIVGPIDLSWLVFHNVSNNE